MRRILNFMITAILVVTTVFNTGASVVAASPSDVFSDIKGHWAEDTITRHYQKGMLKGYPDGTFKPNQTMTRAELVSLINRYMGLIKGTEDNYVDVSKDAWYSGETSRAKYYDYIASSKVNPNVGATRQAVVEMLSRIIDVEEQKKIQTVSDFKDLEGISNEARDSILKFSEMGYIQGYPDGLFLPNKTINRAEIMTMMDAVLGYIITCQEDLENIPKAAKKLTIIAPNLIIENKTIDGDLYISPGVMGSTTIKNTTVKGSIQISGGTDQNPVILDTVKADKVVVTKSKEKPRIKITGSVIGEVKKKSESTIEKEDTDKKIESTSKKVEDSIKKPLPEENNTSGSGSSTNTKKRVEALEIKGSISVGNTVVATVVPEDATVAYQWQREIAEGTYVDIEGATAKDYILKEEDIDKKIQAKAVGTGRYRGEVMSNSLGPVETNDPIAIKIKEGFIPVANKVELKQIEIGADNVFGAGTEYEGIYTGGLDKKYIQVADIDLIDDNFLPIGYNENTDTASDFVGTYVGNDFEIKNLSINRDRELQGLFSKLGKGAYVVDITLEGASLKTSSRTGALAGESDGAIVENSRAHNVSFEFYEQPEFHIKKYIGGFIGKAKDTSLRGLELDGFEMLSKNLIYPFSLRESTGGIVGLLNGGEIKNTHVNNLNIDATEKVYEGIYFTILRCGGVVGSVENGNTTPLVIEDCSASDSNFMFVGTTMERTGGLIGEIDTVNTPNVGDITIRNCTASGDIGGKENFGVASVGGFIARVNGANTPSGYVLIENCNTSVNINELGINPSNTDTVGSAGIGGFAAVLEKTKIVDSHAEGSVEAVFLCGAGGFVGQVYNSSFEDCSAKGNIRGFYILSAFATNVRNCEINRCYATGDVNKSLNEIAPIPMAISGGFTYMAFDSNISDCYYLGDIGDEDSQDIGGFAYGISGNTTLRNVYTRGSVKGSSSVYTFVNMIDPTASTVGCRWNKTNNPSGIGIGRGTGDVIGVEENDLK